MKFENVKVGDIVQVPHILSYNHGWGNQKFRKLFFLGYRVTKVTKTQFTASFQNFEFRFKKDGSGFGCDKVAYNVGDAYRSLTSEIEVPHCQYREYLKYLHSIKTLKGVNGLDIKISDCNTIETALKVAELLKQAAKLIEGQ